MNPWLAALIGYIAGGVASVFIIALLVAARRGDDMANREWREQA